MTYMAHPTSHKWFDDDENELWSKVNIDLVIEMEYATMKSDDGNDYKFKEYIFYFNESWEWEENETDERDDKNERERSGKRLGQGQWLGLDRGTMIILCVLRYRDFYFTYPSGNLLILVIVRYIQQIKFFLKINIYT